MTPQSPATRRARYFRIFRLLRTMSCVERFRFTECRECSDRVADVLHLVEISPDVACAITLRVVDLLVRADAIELPVDLFVGQMRMLGLSDDTFAAVAVPG